jgi:DNA replication protein DnaC
MNDTSNNIIQKPSPPIPLYLPDFVVYIPEYSEQDVKDEEDVELTEYSRSERSSTSERNFLISRMNSSKERKDDNSSFRNYTYNYEEEINRKLLFSIDNKLDRMLTRVKETIENNNSCLNCFCQCLSCVSFILSMFNLLKK